MPQPPVPGSGPAPAASAPAAPSWSPPADLPLGPLPPLSRFWLWMRLWFQWVYLIPLLAFTLGCLALLVFTDGEFGLGGALMAGSHLGPLTPRQYRVEASRDEEAWRRHAAHRLLARTGRAERRELRRRAKARAKGRTRTPEPPRVTLPVQAYRGLGVRGLAATADAHGWAVDWKRSTKPRASLHLVCVKDLDTPAGQAGDASEPPTPHPPAPHAPAPYPPAGDPLARDPLAKGPFAEGPGA